jgi:hypothetical protein
MRILPISLALLPLIFACGEKGSNEETTDTAASSSDSLFDNTDPTEEVAVDAPTITNADAWCFVPGGSTEGEQWGFKFSFDDPQGVETVPRLQMGAIQILNSSGIATSTLDPACGWDTQECASYPFTTLVGTGCDAATTISVKFQITDEDGNVSNSITLDGRLGEDFEG